MKCKLTNKDTPACVDVSWTTIQSRKLNDYKRIGHEVAFKKHLEYLKGLGCEVNMYPTEGGFKVSIPE